MSACVQADSTDEVGLLGKSFNHMVEISRQREVLSELLMLLHSSSQGEALHITLERISSYLGLDRAFLFKDSADLQTCEAMYEWYAEGLAPIMGRSRTFF